MYSFIFLLLYQHNELEYDEKPQTDVLSINALQMVYCKTVQVGVKLSSFWGGCENSFVGLVRCAHNTNSLDCVLSAMIPCSTEACRWGAGYSQSSVVLDNSKAKLTVQCWDSTECWFSRPEYIFPLTQPFAAKTDMLDNHDTNREQYTQTHQQSSNRTVKSKYVINIYLVCETMIVFNYVSINESQFH